MENTTTQNTNTNEKGNGTIKPDFIAKTKQGYGKTVSFERVGAAWNREENGGLYLKFHGTQIIDGPVYLFPANSEPQ